jgi:sarcosine oxidase subunit alpha
MRVDGRPNVRTCTEVAQQGQVVEGQNAWPALSFDLLRIFDYCHRFLPVGFYYKRFHKPRWMWPLFEHVVRHIAGLGRIDLEAPPSHSDVEHLHADVCVIGAGPAGLAAAAAAAEAGADVILLERQARWGGHLLYQAEPERILGPLASSLEAHRANVRVLLETTAFGLYEGNLIGAFQKHRLLKIRAGNIVVSTGARQRPFLFPNNDLPGIFLGDAVLRLARLYGIRAGKRAVVLTDNDTGHRLAGELLSMGIEVAAVVDTRPTGSGTNDGFEVLTGHLVLRARARSQLRGVTAAPVTADGSIAPGSEKHIDCDLLCMASQRVPANELIHQGGMRFSHEGGRWLPALAVPGLLAAGSAAGTFELADQLEEGYRRGLEAAGLSAPDERRGGSIAQFPALPDPFDSKCFVCLCEDVSTKDLRQAVAEGFDHVETLKRYSTAGMGPCQGKMCGSTFSEVCARLSGSDVGTVGTTTSRPPVVPVELSVLAAERRHHPIRRTPIHYWHEAAGARWLDAGQWKRPESYGDPAGEVRAVRSGVGLIDVSTLGKIDVLGPDAAELLERIYVNEWRNLGVGRTRYGLMCTEEGIVFDDGVGARLATEHFYLTATTGNAESVFQWLELWRTTWRLKATVLNQTSAFAALNLAGPRSREVLRQLTALDVSPTSFPYAAVREADVAGVPCRLLRVGFVGEVGYEIHCPSAYGLHLWEAIMAAGSEARLRPFGVEAQRILRLEKGHLIVGQDTDALADPLGAGLGRMVRFAKPLFHGRASLLRLRDKGPRSQLVGFHLPDGDVAEGGDDWTRRLEGCQVVELGRPAGRVTSARYSPSLGKYLGLAWVRANRARPAERFSIRHDNLDLEALVTPIPFYDPQGERLKS